MKVYINNYRSHWLSPYTIMEKVMFWKKWTDPTFDLYDGKNDHYTNWLNGTMKQAQKCLDFIHPKIDLVKIDHWDTWSMDSTLSGIILPMLKQLHSTKQGSPYVDDIDVPMHLQSCLAQPKDYEWDIDSNHEGRWDWAMEEMIWAFEQLQPDCNWEQQFYSGEHDTFKIDTEGMTKHQERINNGLRLFGKYYQRLWD